MQHKYESPLKPMSDQLQNQAMHQQTEGDEICVRVRDLDSGVFCCVDPENVNEPTILESSRKISAWEDYWQQRESNKHLLIKLVSENKADALENILEHKGEEIDLNEYVYLDGWSLLHHAVSKRLFQVVHLLIANSCDVNKQTQSMRSTPLHLAVLENQEEIAKLLLVYGASPNLFDIDFNTPLHYAVQFGYLSMVQVFLNSEEEPIDFKIKNNKKMTAVDCCRDLRIKQIIQEYCQIYDCKLHINTNQSRIVDIGDGHSLITRSRTDFIQKIIIDSTQPKPHSNKIHNEQSYECSKSIPNYRYPKLGSKFNKERLQRINCLAKWSAQNYKNSFTPIFIESLENYDIIKKLGSGSFGTVFLIRRRQSSKLFAMKRLNKKFIIQHKLKKYAYAQREVLKSFKHPFLLHGFSFFQDNAYLYIVMDFCAGGDLEQRVRKSKLSEEMAKKYCCEVILALEELHRQNYLFRDLKVANVLIDEEGHVKLADFGLAKQSELSHSFLGSVCYLAPQMLVDTENKPHTACIDWYLLGVFVYQMVTGLPPFYNQNRMVMFDQIKKMKPKIPENLSIQCKDFLRRTLAKNPNQRLGNKGASEIKSHNWFKQIDWKIAKERGLKMQIPQINQKQLRVKKEISDDNNGAQQGELNFFKGWDYNESNC